jgi:hypothetical protein
MLGKKYQFISIVSGKPPLFFFSNSSKNNLKRKKSALPLPLSPHQNSQLKAQQARREQLR